MGMYESPSGCTEAISVGRIGWLSWPREKSFIIKFLMVINLDKGILRR